MFVTPAKTPAYEEIPLSCDLFAPQKYKVTELHQVLDSSTHEVPALDHLQTELGNKRVKKGSVLLRELGQTLT